jgi:cobalt-zinc-cadmium efflux system protein
VSSVQDHNHGAGQANRTRLLIAMAIIGAFFILEIVGALISGSLALLADAGHMLSDLVGLFIAFVALTVAARPATDRQTFGFARAEVFGALINGLLLLGIAVFVAIEGVGRLLSPGTVEVLAVPMLVIGVAGLLANVAALLVVRGGAAIATITAAGVILLTGFVQADAIGSLVIAALIAPRAFVLLRDVVRVLSNATPIETNVAHIREHILKYPGVVAVHDVHVWSITSGAKVFTAHIVVDDDTLEPSRAGILLDCLDACLAEHFDVAHSTFQLEPVAHAAHEEISHP